MSELSNLKPFLLSNKELTPKIGPFRVTRIWHQIIDHLYANANVSRRRYQLWQYGDVFCGSNAVDVVYEYLLQNREEFPTEVTRKNAVKVCQSLMDNLVFEAPGKSQQSQKFEDNPNKYYKFTSQSPDLGRTDENMGTPTSKAFTEFKVCPNPNFSSRTPTPSRGPSRRDPTRRSLDPGVLTKRKKENFFSSPLMQFSQPNASSFSRRTGLRRRHSFIAALQDCNISDDTNRPNLRMLELKFNRANTRKSLRLSMGKSTKAVKVNTETVSQSKKGPTTRSSHSRISPLNIDRELVLCHLLTLVDIPFLETILDSQDDLHEVLSCSKSNQTTSLGFTNVTPDLARIPWVVSATVCLGYLPEGLESLWSAQACKLKCYQAVLDHYTSLLAPILPDSCEQICLAILELLEKGNSARALRVVNLMMHIIPAQRKAQIEKLCHFLRVVSEDLFVTIYKQLNNHDAVIRDFSNIFLNRATVTQGQRSTFLQFILMRSSSIFSTHTPTDLFGSECGDLVFCKRIRRRDFGISTRESLINLAETVNQNERMTEKDKKNWRKKFQKAHPDLVL